MTPREPNQRADSNAAPGAGPEALSNDSRGDAPNPETDAEPLVEMPRSPLSLRTAMVIYALLAAFALGTLHGDWLLVALLVIFAIALKTWIAQIRDRLE